MTPPDSRARAATALGVPPDADASTIRAAFLQTLTGANFVPPEATVAAASSLGVETVPLTPDAVASEVAAFRAEVEEFALAYWSLPPAVRRTYWADLSARCRDSGCQARLRHLEAGLDGVPTPLADPAAEELAAVVRELYVLTPRGRSVRRAEWLADRAEFSLLEAKTKLHRDADPVTSNLVAGLFGSQPSSVVDQPSLANKRVAAAVTDHRRAIEDFTRRMEEWRTAEGTNRRPAAQGPARPQTESNTASHDATANSNSGIVIALVVLVVLVMGFSIGGNSRKPTKSTPSVNPSSVYQSPTQTQQWPGGDRPVRLSPEDFKLTPEQFEEILRYDPKSGKPPPTGYTTWRLIGSPTPANWTPQRENSTVPTARR